MSNHLPMPSNSVHLEEIHSFRFDDSSLRKKKLMETGTTEKITSMNLMIEPFQSQSDALRNIVFQLEIKLQKLEEEPLLFGKKKGWVKDVEEQTLSSLALLYSRLDDLQSYYQRVGRFQIPSDSPSPNFITKLALKAIHPAAIIFHGKELSKPDSELSMDQKQIKNDMVDTSQGSTIHITHFEQIGEAKRVHFYTEDHIQLEGCIVFGKAFEQELKNKKILVMTQGNKMFWQMAFAHAQAFATKYDINVLIYNPRGVGKSLGETTDTQSSVLDCRAAIQFALGAACNENGTIKHDALGVYGHSLGGGITAEAIKTLITDQIIPDGVLGIYINHHSFSSLRQMIYQQSFSLGLLATNYLRLSNFNMLESAQTLNTCKLAQEVIIVSALQDEIIHADSSLAAQVIVSKSPNKLTFIAMEKLSHNHEKIYFSLGKGFNAHDKSELDSYHLAIHDWVSRKRVD